MELDITDNIVKKNLDLAHRQEIKNKKEDIHPDDAPTHHSIPEDTTLTVLTSRSIQHQHIYIAFSQGLYPYQEDRAQCVMIQNLPELTHQNFAKILYETILKLGESFKHYQSGSTLSVFLITHHFLVTANVGDSRIMLINKKNNEYVCQRVTWDHKPYEEFETNRIETSGGKVIYSDTFRLNNILAVSRSLGDAAVGSGLSFEPDITWINTETFKQAYVLACTDGITDALHEKDITLLFNQEKDIKYIPTDIHQIAFAKESPDNKTLILSPILHPTHSKNIILGFVADGHGGHHVSELIRENFVKTFLEITQKNYPNNHNHAKIIPLFNRP